VTVTGTKTVAVTVAPEPAAPPHPARSIPTAPRATL